MDTRRFFQLARERAARLPAEAAQRLPEQLHEARELAAHTIQRTVDGVRTVADPRNVERLLFPENSVPTWLESDQIDDDDDSDSDEDDEEDGDEKGDDNDTDEENKKEENDQESGEVDNRSSDTQDRKIKDAIHDASTASTSPQAKRVGDSIGTATEILKDANCDPESTGHTSTTKNNRKTISTYGQSLEAFKACRADPSIRDGANKSDDALGSPTSAPHPENLASASAPLPSIQEESESAGRSRSFFSSAFHRAPFLGLFQVILYNDFVMAQLELSKRLCRQSTSYALSLWKNSRFARRVIDYWALNLIYVTVLSVIGSLFILLFESLRGKNSPSSNYFDCLFLSASAVTGTGITVYPLYLLSSGTVATCYVLMTAGSKIWLAIPPVLLRRYIYRRDAAVYVSRRGDFSMIPAGPAGACEDLQQLDDEQNDTLSQSHDPNRGDHTHATGYSTRTNVNEYNAAGVLLKIFLSYILVVQMLGFCGMWLYSAFSITMGSILAEQRVPAWAWAIFHSSSSFYNTGFSLLPDSMQPMGNEKLMITATIALVAVGNCLFPVILRWILVFLSRHPSWFTDTTHDALNYLIRNPRRSSIHLFEDRESMILLLTWLALIVLQVVAMLSIELFRSALAQIDTGKKIGYILFQAISNRTAGFSIIDIENFSKPIQLVFCFVIFMDCYPLLLTIKYTGSGFAKVKRLLHKQHHTPAPVALSSTPASPTNASTAEPSGNPSAQQQQASTTHLQQELNNSEKEHFELLQWILSDMGLVYLFLFIVILAEVAGNDDTDVFDAMFEIVTCFSTVGISVLPSSNKGSFEAGCTIVSKIVLIITMLLGHSRSVPATLDYSVVKKGDRLRPKKAQRKKKKAKRKPSFQVVASSDADLAPVIGASTAILPGSQIVFERK